ncbi:hypothetical protein DL96DRAFT_1591264 [Flagelloscypha sp. PMI_526]|nr:hypothetical protein DL96DRAFT_1591264 [Flagelloscypha sp. PMI_526]
MFTSTKSLMTFVALFAASASAATLPVVRQQQTCSPPFTVDKKTTIANSAVRIAAPVVAAGNLVRAGDIFDWSFEPKDSFFLIHPASDPSLSLQGDPFNGEAMSIVASEPYNFKQQFRVTCSSGCSPDQFFFGDGCVITAVGDTTKCLQLGPGPTAANRGDTAVFKQCDGSDSQRFNFENRVNVY